MNGRTPGFDRELLTPAELADRWGISVGHLANLRATGRGLSYIRIGGRIAYRAADVLAYETAHYVEVG